MRLPKRDGYSKHSHSPIEHAPPMPSYEMPMMPPGFENMMFYMNPYYLQMAQMAQMQQSMGQLPPGMGQMTASLNAMQPPMPPMPPGMGQLPQGMGQLPLMYAMPPKYPAYFPSNANPNNVDDLRNAPNADDFRESAHGASKEARRESLSKDSSSESDVSK
jgi:hypothetical protein